MDDERKCPVDGTVMYQGRPETTQDGKVYHIFVCPKCGHKERVLVA